WTVPGNGPSVTVDSVTPNSGMGSSQTFALRYSDTMGATNISTAWLWFVPSVTSSTANSCMAYYQSSSNTMVLLNDAGTQWTSGVAGGPGTLSNSQCSIDLSNTTTTLSGTALTLNANMTFSTAFAGWKYVRQYAENMTGANSGDWQTRGVWTVPG